MQAPSGAPGAHTGAPERQTLPETPTGASRISSISGAPCLHPLLSGFAAVHCRGRTHALQEIVPLLQLATPNQPLPPPGKVGSSPHPLPSSSLLRESESNPLIERRPHPAFVSKYCALAYFSSRYPRIAAPAQIGSNLCVQFSADLPSRRSSPPGTPRLLQEEYLPCQRYAQLLQMTAARSSSGLEIAPESRLNHSSKHHEY